MPRRGDFFRTKPRTWLLKALPFPAFAEHQTYQEQGSRLASHLLWSTKIGRPDRSCARSNLLIVESLVYWHSIIVARVMSRNELRARDQSTVFLSGARGLLYTSRNYKLPVAPVVQLVTSKPSDVGTLVRISVQSHELEFFLTKIQKIKK